MASQQQPATAQVQQLQLLRGAGPGQFNLEAVRLRASELRASLVEVLHTLQKSPQLLHWDAILKKYSTINLQLLALRESLRGVLRQVVVHPCMVDQPALSQVLPIQLASAILPEQVESEKQVLASEEQLLVAAGLPVEAWYEAIDTQVEDYNRLILQLVSGGTLDTQSEPRKALGSRSMAIIRSLAAARQGQPLSAVANASIGAKRPRLAQSGPPEPAAFDPVLRQLLTGEVSKPAR